MGLPSLLISNNPLDIFLATLNILAQLSYPFLGSKVHYKRNEEDYDGGGYTHTAYIQALGPVVLQVTVNQARVTF